MRDINIKELELLKDYTMKVLEKCKISSEINIGDSNIPFTLRVPSGDMRYSAFWVRDAAMMAESGLIPAEEIKGWIYLVASGQNTDEPIDLENGLVVPPWAIADHISFEGKPTYYPGTYEIGSNQGNGTFGFYPPHDDQYYFIEMAYLYYQKSNNPEYFYQDINGIQVKERLERAFESYNIDEKTQLCTSNFPQYTVDWGFCDSVTKSGSLLFPSLLRYRAALRLIEIFSVIKEDLKAEKYLEISQLIKENIMKTFYDVSGWFLSATGVCCQYDVWGTAFALWLDIPTGVHKQRSAEALMEAFRNGTAVNNGYVRHILTEGDASGKSAWESASSVYNENYTYQDGGYWATPTGWYIYALFQVDKGAAIEMLDLFIQHTVEFDSEGAPFEWRWADDGKCIGRFYGTSAALPYTAVKRILQIR